MRKFLLSLFCLLMIARSSAQVPRFALSGTVKDSANNEPLIGALVYVEEQKDGDITNENGSYSLTLLQGKYTVKISYTGYNSKTVFVDLSSHKTLNVRLATTSVDVKEVVISGERKDANVSSTNMGRQVITMETAKALPALLGEVDVLKVLQTLPGVQAGGEGNSGFYVRGGGPDQNLVLLDDATIYNTGHLFGFFSVFNADVVKSVTLEKGSMAANYGGRISSVVDVRTKEPDMKRWHVDGGIGLIASRLTVQGPIKKDRCSILLSGRRTYIDAITAPLFKNMQGGAFAGDSYYFYDVNGKINIKLTDKDRLSFSGYYGRDVFSFKDPEGNFKMHFPWGNTAATARYTHVFNPKFFMSVSGVYTGYEFSANVTFAGMSIQDQMGIKQMGGRIAFEYNLSDNNSMKFGAESDYYIFTPHQMNATTSSGSFGNPNANSKHAQLSSIYFNDDFDVNSWFRLSVGVRASLYNLIGPYQKVSYNDNGTIQDSISAAPGKNVKMYWGLEPRIGARFKLAKATSLKAGFHMTRQYVHQIPTTNTSLPINLWVPSSQVIKPQTGLQGSLGIFQNLLDDMLEMSVEGYYKYLFNQIEIGQSAVQNISEDVEDTYTFGRGWAYGAEFFVKKAKGRWTGWIGYTLAWARRQFPGIDGGIVFPSTYDRRHDLNIVLMWDITKRWKVSSTFVFASGNTTTLPEAIYFINGNIHYEWGKRNSFRLPPYNRLDIGVTYVIPTKKNWYNDIAVSVYNLYNRQNPYFVYVQVSGSAAKGNQKAVLKQSSLFPILPSVTWNFKW